MTPQPIQSQAHTTAELDSLLAHPATAAETPELASLRSALASLRVTSLAAAERTLSARAPVASTYRISRFALTCATTCATAALAVAVAIPVSLHRSRTLATPVTTTTAAPASAADTTIADDDLLSDIQTDLNTSVPTPLQPLAAASTTSTQ